MARPTFNFKNTGRKASDRKFDNTENSKIQNIGIKTPISNAKGEEIFDMHQDPRAQLKDNLKNLILTHEGERVCMVGFGANLKNLLYDMSAKSQYEGEVARLITDAVLKHLPMISIDEIEIASSSDQEKFNANSVGMTELIIRILYSIPKFRIDKQGLEVKMLVGG